MHRKRLIQLAFAFVSLGVEMNGQSVYVMDSLQRVSPTATAGSGSGVTLYAAKGEAESFQIIVKAPSSSVSVSSLTASNLTGPNGATISHSNYTFYRELYVDITASSPDFGTGNRPLGAGWYPDALIPFIDPATGLPPVGATYNAVPYTISANENAPFWIDINVPRNAVPGQYTGTITVAISGGDPTSGASDSISVTLNVWHFSLPENPNLKSSFGFHSNLATEANNQLLLQHRLQPFVVPSSQAASLIPMGIGLFGLPYYNESSGCTINPAPSVSNIQSVMQKFPGGYPTYVYPADEVSRCTDLATTLKPWSVNAHEAGAKVLVTTVPTSSLLADGTGHTYVDYWVLGPKQYCSSGKINTSGCVENPLIATVRNDGNETWSYNEEEQDYYSPKWLLDFAPINYRIFPGFINQRFGFTGLLYCNVAHWSSDPWHNVQSWVAAGYTFPGDDVLVYPGTEVGISTVVPSLRLKFVRDGVDDYDYMAMLKQQGQSAFVQSILNSLVPDWINWTKNTTTLANARIQMGQELDKLAGGSSALAAPSNPWPTSGSVGGGTNLTLQWSSVSGATQYQLYLGTSSSSLPLYATVAASTGANVDEKIYHLASQTTYYWKVVATNSSASTNGPVWSFKTP